MNSQKLQTPKNQNKPLADQAVSVCPNGHSFPLPREKDYAAEYKRLARIVAAERKKGREIVVVMGVGFVGAVMAGVVADSVDRKTGRPGKFVIGMQRPSPRSFWKIAYLNKGVAPVEADDPEVARMIKSCVKDKKTLIATYTYDVLKLADVVVVDVQCDYHKETFGNVRQGRADIKALEECLKVIGEKIEPDCMVLIETTVPPGTTEYVAYPIVKREFERRGIKGKTPLLTHSFERVMPGRNYVASVRDFWRVCSGITPEARARVVKFLTEVLNVDAYPLTVLDRPIESETCKIVENSYRAAILAFNHEWSLFAERNGVDLVKVLKAIKVRPTHSNIMMAGPGIGGYCLPKDGGLARRPAQHGQDRGRLPGGSARGLLPGGCGRHALLGLRGRRAQTDRDGRRRGGARPLFEALVGAGKAGDLPGTGALPGALLQKPGAPGRAAPAQDGGRGPQRRGCRRLRGAARGLPGPRPRCGGRDDRPAGRRGGLLRHPR